MTATTNDPLSYIWELGDGVTVGPQPTPRLQLVHASPGRHAVTLTVTNDLGTSRCGAVRIVHTPVTRVAPVSSSSIITTGQDTYVVNPDNDTVTRIDGAHRVVWEAAVGDQPRTLAAAPDGDLWVVNQGSGDITVLTSAGAVRRTIPLPRGSAPYGCVFAPDGGAVYVSLQAAGRLLKLDPSGAVRADLAVGPQPRGLAVSGDSARLLVTRFVSRFREVGAVGEVWEVDTGSFTVSRTLPLAFDPGPDTEASGRGVPNYLSQVRIAPDGRSAWVPSKKDNIARGRARDGLDLTFESRTRTIVSMLDLVGHTERLERRIDFNDRDLAQTTVFTPTGDVVLVAMLGSNVVEIRDAQDRTRLGLIPVGRAPAGLALSADGSRLYVHNYLDRSVTVADTSRLLDGTANQAPILTTVSTVSHEALPAPVLNGKRTFYNAADPRMSRDGYLSCASCHLDGGSDQMVWDFTQSGEGLRNTIELTGRRGTNGGFVHWTANFDEIQDFENDIRAAFGGTGFMSDAAFNTGTRRDPLGDRKAGLSQPLDDLAAYVSSLARFAPSPYRRADGGLTAAGLAGRVLFLNQGCDRCHSGPDFTDDLRHDVGTQPAASGSGHGAPLDAVGFNTPTLKGLWLGAPYLHDGRAETLGDVLADAAHVGTTLSAEARADLEAYLLQIDDAEANAAVPVPFTDQPLTPGVTPIRAVHIEELRARINALRAAACGLPAYAFTDPDFAPGTVVMKLAHLAELRSALDAAYHACGWPSPTYTDPVLVRGASLIRVAHIEELRAAVQTLEQEGVRPLRR